MRTHCCNWETKTASHEKKAAPLARDSLIVIMVLRFNKVITPLLKGADRFKSKQLVTFGTAFSLQS